MKKCAVITGAGSGIGKSTALTLAKHGWTIIAVGRNIESISEVAKQSGNSSVAIVCDVADPKSVSDLFTKISTDFERIDLLFNNAGIGTRYADMDELTSDEWLSVVNTNLNGSFFCTQKAFGLMKKQSPQGGRIINNGSIAAYAPRPNSAPYTATKHAITGLTKSTSLDGRRYNIACGQIDVGNADTAIAVAQKQGIVQSNGEKAIEPTIDAQIVADAVLHMAELPLDANVLFMTVMATKMPYVGRG
jgi:NAD(P)-dependent dehydrogenase (short-subunit alcohol dehydrogenase family)